MVFLDYIVELLQTLHVPLQFLQFILSLMNQLKQLCFLICQRSIILLPIVWEVVVQALLHLSSLLPVFHFIWLKIKSKWLKMVENQKIEEQMQMDKEDKDIGKDQIQMDEEIKDIEILPKQKEKKRKKRVYI